MRKKEKSEFDAESGQLVSTYERVNNIKKLTAPPAFFVLRSALASRLPNSRFAPYAEHIICSGNSPRPKTALHTYPKIIYRSSLKVEHSTLVTDSRSPRTSGFQERSFKQFARNFHRHNRVDKSREPLNAPCPRMIRVVIVGTTAIGVQCCASTAQQGRSRVREAETRYRVDGQFPCQLGIVIPQVAMTGSEEDV